MVTDSEPRYRLVDANGNIVGTFYAESDGTLKLQEGTSGNDNEVSIQSDGTVDATAFSQKDTNMLVRNVDNEKLDGASNKPIFSIDNVSDASAGRVMVAGNGGSANRGGFDTVYYSHDRITITEEIPKSDFFQSFTLSIDGNTVEFTEGDGAVEEITIMAQIAGPRDDFKFEI